MSPLSAHVVSMLVGLLAGYAFGVLPRLLIRTECNVHDCKATSRYGSQYCSGHRELETWDGEDY